VSRATATATTTTTFAYPPTVNEETIDESHELPTPSWRLRVARPDPSLRDLKSLSATGLEEPSKQRKVIVSSLIGERLQIPAMAPVVEMQPSAGADVGRRGVAEGSRRALKPLPLLSRGLLPVGSRVGCVAEPAWGKSNPRLLLDRPELEDE
jgi:hypothetical protein